MKTTRCKLFTDMVLGNLLDAQKNMASAEKVDAKRLILLSRFILRLLKQLAAQHKEQQAVQDANIQSAIDRVIEARKKLDENTAFLDDCRKNREDSKAKYMQVKALYGEFKAIYGQHCDTVRTMENVVRGSQSFLTNAIDSLTIVAKGYPFYVALMDSLLDGLPAEKKEE